MLKNKKFIWILTITFIMFFQIGLAYSQCNIEGFEVNIPFDQLKEQISDKTLTSRDNPRDWKTWGHKDNEVANSIGDDKDLIVVQCNGDNHCGENDENYKIVETIKIRFSGDEESSKTIVKMLVGILGPPDNQSKFSSDYEKFFDLETDFKLVWKSKNCIITFRQRLEQSRTNFEVIDGITTKFPPTLHKELFIVSRQNFDEKPSGSVF